MLDGETKDYKLLAETFTLTAFFRSLTHCYNSEYIIKFLLKISNLSFEDLKKRWDNFDSVFGKEKGLLISALSFSTIIEARGKLLDSIIKDKFKKNDTIILELGSGFSPRGVYFVNNLGYTNYIETDLQKTIGLKNKFYSYLDKLNIKSPQLQKFNVEQKKDWNDIYNHIKILKLDNQKIKKLLIVSEGLLIYLNKKHQKTFFEELSVFAGLLNNEGIKTTYLTCDVPTHENFTNWLISEGFDFTSHIEVMKNVDPTILESLHNTFKDFIMENNLKKIIKHKYSNEIINELNTPTLDKYKNLDDLDHKIYDFLDQDILFAWEYEL